MVIVAIAIVVLIDLKGLLHSEPKGRIRGIYFSVIAVSLLLGILISIDKAPESPNMVIINMAESFGWEEK